VAASLSFGLPFFAVEDIMKCSKITILAVLTFLPAGAAENPSGDAQSAWMTEALQAQELLHHHQFPQAAESGERALRLAKHFGPADRRVASTHHLLGLIYRDWGHCAEARTNYSRAIAIWRKQAEATHRYLFNAMTNLISVTCECDDFVAADKAFQRYGPDLRRYRSDALDDARVLSLEGVLARNHKDYGRAESLFKQAIVIMEHSPETAPVDLVAERSSLGVIYDKEGRYEEALVESSRAIEYFEKNAPLHPALMASYNNAACSLASLGRNSESQRRFEQALEMGKTLYGEDNHVTAKIMLSYARVLRDNRQSPAASAWQKRGAEAFRRSLARQQGTVDMEDLRKK